MGVRARLAALSNRVPPTPPAGELTTGARSNGLPVAKVDYRRPDPTAVAQQRSIDTVYGRGQAGLTGLIRWGLDGGANRYAGDLGPVQRFHGGAHVGNAASIRPGFRGGLPATSTIPGQPANPMLSLLLADVGNARLATQVKP